MPTKLSRTDEITAGDLVVLWKTADGDYRGLPVTDLVTYLNENLTFPDAGFTTQYSAPSATGFSVDITDGSDDIWLILTPAAGYAAGTIVLPDVANAVDGQEVMINCTQVVTTLTIDGNGATAVTGEPATLAANDFFTLRYDAATSTWYRVK